MPVDLPQISAAEWDVMRVVWDRGTVTADQVVAGLSSRRNWNPRTIRTMLGRLAKKGVLGFTQSGRHYEYHATVGREACIRSESRSFLSRVFDGAVAPAIVNLVDAADLDPKQIADLQAILDARSRSGRAEPSPSGDSSAAATSGSAGRRKKIKGDSGAT